MKSLPFYKFAALGLLLINLLLIAFFVFKKPPPTHENQGIRFQQQAIKILQLDESQQAVFSTLAKAHNEEMLAINEQQRSLLNAHFKQLIDSTQPVDTNLDQIQGLEGKKIEITYQHFQEIKTILNKDQEKNFENFMIKALQIILTKKKAK